MDRPIDGGLVYSNQAMSVNKSSIDVWKQVSKLNDDILKVKELYLEDEEFRHWFDAYRVHYDKIQSNHAFKYFQEELISDPDKLFHKWATFYGKSYDEEMLKKRMTTFRKNARIFYYFNKSCHDVFFYGKRFLYAYSDCLIADAKSLKMKFFMPGDYPFDPIGDPHLKPFQFAKMCTEDHSLIPPYPPEKRKVRGFIQRHKDRYIKNPGYRTWLDSRREAMLTDCNEGLKYDEEELVSDDHLEDLFKRWLRHNRTSYPQEEEWKMRFEVFKKNARYVYEANKSSHDVFFVSKLRMGPFSAYFDNEVGGMLDDDETEVEDLPHQAPTVTTSRMQQASQQQVVVSASNSLNKPLVHFMPLVLTISVSSVIVLQAKG